MPKTDTTSNTDALNALFDQLAQGEMPNIIELIAALSRVSELMTDTDQPSCSLNDFCTTCD